MNIAKTTERALGLVISQYATTVAGVNIRPFQSLSEDPFRPTDEAGGYRYYPLIDIRCSTPNVNPSQHTESVQAVLTVATNEDDDQGHLQLSQIYSAIETVLQALFDQIKTTDGEELTLFRSVYTDAHGSGFLVSGITFAGGESPYDDEGVAVISQSINVHYARG